MLIELFEQGLARDVNMRFSSCSEMKRNLGELAFKLNIFDPLHYLKQLIKADDPAWYKRSLRRQKVQGLASLIYLSLAATVLGLSVWAITAVLADIFEPKHQHNFPVWQEQEKFIRR
jgi:hypothetical protein